MGSDSANGTSSTTAVQKQGGSTSTKTAASTSSNGASNSASGGTGQKDVFARTLTVKDMVVYGLISMVPISPFSIYASVFDMSNGMPALTYFITACIMMLTVLSFGMMIPKFPSSGSIFVYVSHGVGKGLGFIAGWLMLLQYLVYPVVVYIMGGLALNQYFPVLPVWGWCVIFLALVTFVALRGMQTTMIVNKIALAGEIIVLAMFLGLAVFYIVTHPGNAGFSATAFINPEKFNMGDTMSSVALAAQSFVGFGCVATLAEEAKNGKQGPGRAMLIMMILLGTLFTLTCFVATCADPSGAVFKGNEDNGFYLIAQLVSGPWFAIVCAVAVALSQGIFTGLVNVVSVSRIIFSMGRSNALPKIFAKFDKKTNTPYIAVIFVCTLSLVLLPIMIALGLDKVATISNFGALSTYLLLNICVIWYFWVKLKEHKRIGRTLICPGIGAIMTAYILASSGTIPITVGLIWTGLGIIYYLVATRILHRNIDLA